MKTVAWIILGLMLGFFAMGALGAAGGGLQHNTTFSNGGGQLQSSNQPWGVVGGTWENQPQRGTFLLQPSGTFPTPARAPQNYVQQCAGVPGPCPNGFYVWSADRQNEWLQAQGR